LESNGIEIVNTVFNTQLFADDKARLSVLEDLQAVLYVYSTTEQFRMEIY